MAQMRLVLTIRKDVVDRDQGELIYDLVKTRLADRPDLTLTGHVTNHFNEAEDPPE